MSLSRPRLGREEEEGGGDEGQRESTPGKRPRRCCCPFSSCQETKDFYESRTEILMTEMQRLSDGFIDLQRGLREMQEFYQNSQMQSMEKIYGRMEQLNAFISELSTPGDKHLRNCTSLRAIPNQNQTRTYRLKFKNKCCNAKYSRHDITADDGSPIKVALYDQDNRIITNGTLSSLQVEIVVLNGEFNNDNKEQWSKDAFDRSIIESRPGKPPLFSNKLYLRLENGVATLHGAKFQDNSSFVPSKKFRMGVKASDPSMSEKIMEGISEPFSVLDGRGFAKKKDLHPSLSDPIYKLKKIAENGDRHKQLKQVQIKLVQDFVRFYKKDKDSLRKACLNISDHDWDIIVKHALSCKPGHERYSYHIPEKDATIFFDSVYNIIGAEFSGAYSSYEELDHEQKGLVEASKMTAYDNLKVVKHEGKKHCYEHELTAGDRGCNYSRGSCSNLSLPTKIHDEISEQGKGLQSGPAQESPRARPTWTAVMITITTARFWKKKKPFTWITDRVDNLPVFSESGLRTDPVTENSFGMADTANLSEMEPVTSHDMDLEDIWVHIGNLSPILGPGYV